MLVHLILLSCILYKLEGIILMLFFHSFFFYDLNFVSLIDDIKLRVPSPNIRNFTMFPAALKNCPAGCATAATLEWLDVDICSKQIISLKQILS
jgi:hypothetical protein